MTPLLLLAAVASLGVGHGSSGVMTNIFAPPLLIGLLLTQVGVDKIIGNFIGLALVFCLMAAQFPFYGYISGKVYNKKLNYLYLLMILVGHIVSGIILKALL